MYKAELSDPVDEAALPPWMTELIACTHELTSASSLVTKRYSAPFGSLKHEYKNEINNNTYVRMTIVFLTPYIYL